MRTLKIMLAVMVAFCSMPAFAQDKPAEENAVAKLTYGPDKWIDIHFLGQIQAVNSFWWDTTSSVETKSDGAWATSFMIRRARVILNASVAKNVTLFWESDDYKRGGQGNDGAATGSVETNKDSVPGSFNDKIGMFTQDCYINYKIAPEFQLAFGMILLPFMHLNRQSAVSPLGVDYDTAVVNLYATNVWRDTGFEARGLLFNGLIDYRLGVFQGKSKSGGTDVSSNDDVNPNGFPRLTGRVQLNLLDAEDGFFYSGNYLGKKKIASFGAGYDFQQKSDLNGSGATADVKNYMAWTIDFFVDYPIDPATVFTFQAAYVNMKHRPAADYEKEYGYFIETGCLFMGSLQPVLKYMTWVAKDNVTTGRNATTTYLVAGLNYFINGHNANLKFEYRFPLGKDENGVKQTSKPGEKQFILQCQVFI